MFCKHCCSGLIQLNTAGNMANYLQQLSPKKIVMEDAYVMNKNTTGVEALNT